MLACLYLRGRGTPTGVPCLGTGVRGADVEYPLLFAGAGTRGAPPQGERQGVIERVHRVGYLCEEGVTMRVVVSRVMVREKRG